MILVVLVAFSGLAGLEAASGGSTAEVANVDELQAAFRNQAVDTINVRAGSSISRLHNHSAPHAPFLLTRNLTLQGQPGKAAMIDLNFADGLLQLCSTCTYIMRNITVANERWGTGPQYDILWGQPGSRVISENVLRLRLACVPPELPLKTYANSSRSSAFPGADRPQQLSIQPITVLGRECPGSLVYRDVSLEVPLEHNEGWGFTGGYSLSLKNDALLCQHTVSQECLARKPGDACVNDLLDKLTDGGDSEAAAAAAATAWSSVVAAPPAAAPQAAASAGRVASIAVPVAVSVLALLAIIVLQLRKRKLKQALAKAQRFHHDAEGGNREHFNTGPASYTLSPMGASKGWELHSRLTSPLVQGDVDDDTIHFGELLGAGSFGRVFKGRWAGRSVAIKVIEHSSSTLAAVENEVRLMLSFNHPHLVRALHCVTLVCPHTTPSSACAAPSSDCSSSHEPGGGSSDSKARAQDALQTMPSHDSEQHALGRQPERQESDVFSSTNGSAYGLSSGHPGSSKGTWGGCSTRSDLGDRRAETRLVLEFCDGGTLRSHVAQFWRPDEQQQDGGCSSAVGSPEELRLLVLLHGAAAGLEVLHSSNVVHSDLNAQNVLVSSSAAAPFGAVAKISDLGLARVMGENRTHRTTNTLGTLNHLAPEQLRSGKTSPAGDIYAFGIMLYELYAGSTAFRKLHNVGQFYETVVLHNLRPLVPQSMPADLRLLMEHCWAAEPQDRPTAARVVERLRVMIQERQRKSSVLPGIAEMDTAAGPSTIAAVQHNQQPKQQREPSWISAPGSGFFRLGSRSSSRPGSGFGSRPDSRSGASGLWSWGSRNSGSGSQNGGLAAVDRTFTCSSNCNTLGTCDDTAFDSRGSRSPQLAGGSGNYMQEVAGFAGGAGAVSPQAAQPAARSAVAPSVSGDGGRARPGSGSGGKASLLDQLRQASFSSLMNGSFTWQRNSGHKAGSQSGLWFV